MRMESCTMTGEAVHEVVALASAASSATPSGLVATTSQPTTPRAATPRGAWAGEPESPEAEAAKAARDGGGGLRHRRTGSAGSAGRACGRERAGGAGEEALPGTTTASQGSSRNSTPSRSPHKQVVPSLSGSGGGGECVEGGDGGVARSGQQSPVQRRGVVQPAPRVFAPKPRRALSSGAIHQQRTSAALSQGRRTAAGLDRPAGAEVAVPPLALSASAVAAAALGGERVASGRRPGQPGGPTLTSGSSRLAQRPAQASAGSPRCVATEPSTRSPRVMAGSSSSSSAARPVGRKVEPQRSLSPPIAGPPRRAAPAASGQRSGSRGPQQRRQAADTPVGSGSSSQRGASAPGTGRAKARGGDHSAHALADRAEAPLAPSRCLAAAPARPPATTLQPDSTNASTATLRSAVAAAFSAALGIEAEEGSSPPRLGSGGGSPHAVLQFKAGQTWESLAAELHEENMALQETLRAVDQIDFEARQRLREVQVDREMWKHRCDQTQEQLAESWKQYDTMQERWEEAEERILVVRRCWERDRQRLREAERLLRELGQRPPPSLEPHKEDDELQPLPSQSTCIDPSHFLDGGTALPTSSDVGQLDAEAAEVPTASSEL